MRYPTRIAMVMATFSNTCNKNVTKISNGEQTHSDGNLGNQLLAGGKRSFVEERIYCNPQPNVYKQGSFG